MPVIDPTYKSDKPSFNFLPTVPLDSLMQPMQEKLDVFSYHYYNGVSERLKAVMPANYWKPDRALSEDYLAVAGNLARLHAEKRNTYRPCRRADPAGRNLHLYRAVIS